MKDRRLNQDDQKAWDKVRRSIRPLSGDKSPRIKRDVTDHPMLRHLGPEPAKPGQSRSVPLVHRKCTATVPNNRESERKVRRGKVEVSSSFDLHGHTQASAWSALPAFLLREQARGARCVIVVTGKGKLGEGVLRRNFLRWLEEPSARSLVSGYAQAHPRHGGAGAFYVFLKRR